MRLRTRMTIRWCNRKWCNRRVWNSWIFWSRKNYRQSCKASLHSSYQNFRNFNPKMRKSRPNMTLCNSPSKTRMQILLIWRANSCKVRSPVAKVTWTRTSSTRMLEIRLLYSRRSSRILRRNSSSRRRRTKTSKLSCKRLLNRCLSKKLRWWPN